MPEVFYNTEEERLAALRKEEIVRLNGGNYRALPNGLFQNVDDPDDYTGLVAKSDLDRMTAPPQQAAQPVRGEYDVGVLEDMGRAFRGATPSMGSGLWKWAEYGFSAIGAEGTSEYARETSEYAEAQAATDTKFSEMLRGEINLRHRAAPAEFGSGRWLGRGIGQGGHSLLMMFGGAGALGKLSKATKVGTGLSQMTMGAGAAGLYGATVSLPEVEAGYASLLKEQRPDLSDSKIRELVRTKSAVVALSKGISEALITRFVAPSFGAESFLASREAIKATVKDGFLKSTLKHAGGEMIEELSAEMADSLISYATHHPDITAREVFERGVTATVIGGIMGGTMGMLQGGSGSSDTLAETAPMTKEALDTKERESLELDRQFLMDDGSTLEYGSSNLNEEGLPVLEARDATRSPIDAKGAFPQATEAQEEDVTVDDLEQLKSELETEPTVETELSEQEQAEVTAELAKEQEATAEEDAGPVGLTRVDPETGEAQVVTSVTQRSATAKPTTIDATSGAVSEAKVRGIELSEVTGTGKDGRILKRDVQKVVNEEAVAKEIEQGG